MMSLPRLPRLVACPVLALGVGAAVAGCGHPTDRQPAPAAADISRIDNVQHDFPPGFTVQTGLRKTLDEHDIGQAGIHVLTKARLDPPHCLAAIIPPYADPSPGTDAAGVTANGDQGGVHVTALRLPKPVPAGSPPAGCDQIRIASPQLTGTAHRIPAPRIDGVPTTGVKLVENTKKDDYVFPGGADRIIQQDPDYILTAALDDQTVIVVRGAVDERLDPQRLFSDLLVKATTAVRGR